MSSYIDKYSHAMKKLKRNIIRQSKESILNPKETSGEQKYIYCIEKRWEYYSMFQITPTKNLVCSINLMWLRCFLHNLETLSSILFFEVDKGL